MIGTAHGYRELASHLGRAAEADQEVFGTVAAALGQFVVDERAQLGGDVGALGAGEVPDHVGDVAVDERVSVHLGLRP